MAHVSVTIAGRPYRLACNDGEEPHLQSLAAAVDAKMAEIRQSFGEIGDQRITVMAALTLADELAEARRKIAQLDVDLLNLRHAGSRARSTSEGQAASAASALADAARRIELVARELNAGTARESEPGSP